jgi:endoglucanase
MELKNSLRSIFFLITLFIIENSYCQTVPFHRGVNLAGWFERDSPGEIQIYKYTRKDFQDIKSLGCDVIRLPTRLNYMTTGGPDLQLDPLFLTFLDTVVNWAKQTEMHLILDNHTFNTAINTNSSIEDTLLVVWPQLAEYYKDETDLLYYEILNEPHGIDDATWGEIQGHVIEAIREVDTKHTIIVGPASWNSYNNLHLLPDYSDENLIYTFHFYDPFIFTHQGASWSNPSMENLAGIPFPYSVEDMPELPVDLENTWIEDEFNDYEIEGTADKMREYMQLAADFSADRNVPVYCGEFGVYTPNSNQPDRVRWYDTLNSIFVQHEIPWTIWGYSSGFSFFDPSGTGMDMFEHDLDTQIIRALGLNVPEQTDFIMVPDSASFPIYTDMVAASIDANNWLSSGSVNYYSGNHPNNDGFCLEWNGGEQYTYIDFDFKPDKDLSYLEENDYALDFFIRGIANEDIGIDLRFMDTKTDDPNDHPWRMRYTIDRNSVQWNGKWHHLHIPLTDFVEHGAWDNGEWYNPEGLFDWGAVDRFMLVAEHQDITSSLFWFDNMFITDRDTATVLDTTEVINFIYDLTIVEKENLKIAPNPSRDFTEISYSIDKLSWVRLSIYDMMGQEVLVICDERRAGGNYRYTWNHLTETGKKVKPGIYFCKLTLDHQKISNTAKILLVP